MEKFISSETDEELKKAFREMLEGCLTHPGQWDWYAMWMIEKVDKSQIERGGDHMNDSKQILELAKQDNGDNAGMESGRRTYGY